MHYRLLLPAERCGWSGKELSHVCMPDGSEVEAKPLRDRLPARDMLPCAGVLKCHNLNVFGMKFVKKCASVGTNHGKLRAHNLAEKPLVTYAHALHVFTYSIMAVSAVLSSRCCATFATPASAGRYLWPARVHWWPGPEALPRPCNMPEPNLHRCPGMWDLFK
jgi:hypothetical protein